MKIRNYEKDRQNTIKYSVGNIKSINKMKITTNTKIHQPTDKCCGDL